MPVLSGSSALVTDATSGIGRAIALRLAALGAHVIVQSRLATAAAALVNEIEIHRGSAEPAIANLEDPCAVRRLATTAGSVRILVNNVGECECGDTIDLDDAEFTEHVNLNMRAPFILVQALAPHMGAYGGGSIVNLSTIGASVPVRGCGMYGAVKAALELLTMHWASEFSVEGVRVNCVAVGSVRSLSPSSGGANLTEGLAAVTALGRLAEPGEIADVVAFLNTPGAGYINGAIIPVHGGIPALGPPEPARSRSRASFAGASYPLAGEAGG